MGESNVTHIHQLLPTTCQETESSGTRCKPLWSQQMATGISGPGSWIPPIAWAIRCSSFKGVSCKDDQRERLERKIWATSLLKWEKHCRSDRTYTITCSQDIQLLTTRGVPMYNSLILRSTSFWVGGGEDACTEENSSKQRVLTGASWFNL